MRRLLSFVLSQRLHSELPYCLLDPAHEGLGSWNKLAKLQRQHFDLHRELTNNRFDLHAAHGGTGTGVRLRLSGERVERRGLHLRG